MRFNSIIYEKRSRMGIGIRSLSRMLDISPTHLRRLETNQSKPSEELVKKISDVLNMDFDLLMISTNRIPSDIQEYLIRNPSEIRKIRAQITTEV